MHGDLINQLTVSVIFLKDIVKPNCTNGSTFRLSSTLVMYAQNTLTPGSSTFGSMFEEFIQESASPVLFVKHIKIMGRNYRNSLVSSYQNKLSSYLYKIYFKSRTTGLLFV